MGKHQIYIGGSSAAVRYTSTYLKVKGLPVVDEPGPDIGHLLLDIPSFGENGQLRMGGCAECLLSQLPDAVTVYGGNLTHLALCNHRTVDFLQDEHYLAGNAYITAECALDVALPYLTVTLRNCPVLIIGWGRIGKCLGHLLKSLGAKVTIAARKEQDRAMAQSLGFQVCDIAQIPRHLAQYRLVYNTVPFPVLSADNMTACQDACVCIDLASSPGIQYDHTIIARGLPAIHLPESTGHLIAETFLRYYQKEVSL